MVNFTPGHFTHRKNSSTHCIGGWVGLRAGLGHLEENKTAGHPACSPVAMWTALPKPTNKTQLEILDHPEPSYTDLV